MRFGPVIFTSGILLEFIGISMLMPALLDHLDGNAEAFIFFKASAITTLSGALIALLTIRKWEIPTIKEMFLMTALNWVVISLFAALPFYFSPLGMNYSDSFFETMSGITTTGSTVLSELDLLPRGIILWRAFLQWLGGIGIVVLAIAVLPFLGVGGMQLFSSESSDNSEKSFARTSQVVWATVIVYLVISTLCAISMYLAGMGGFDAVAHMMTCVSTGGFSPYDASVGHFKQPAVHWVTTFFMLVCGVPMITYTYIARCKWRLIKEDNQAKWFLQTTILLILALSIWLWQTSDMGFEESARLIAFHIVSLMTTTGFAVTDYTVWGSFFIAIVFVVTMLGGCTGSTAGGIKAFRLHILYLTMKKHFESMLSPHRVFVALYNGRPVTDDIASSVFVFISVFALSVIAIALMLACTGLDFTTSFSGALTAVANVGPGLGDTIGPAGNFSTLSDLAKWVLSFGMLLGRLEFMTVLVVFVPSAWKD
ncbi:MAG: TrkH family potassium uptake protein [Alphaproteobacteria bacterium]|nr:TrkH family potassium uptake protein [Alphaproteobacteria bacterium]